VDLSEHFLAPHSDYEVESVSGLPPGVSFDAEPNLLKGSVSDPGLYEIVFTQTAGPANYFSTIILRVTAAELTKRFELPASRSSSIAYFKGNYYYPSSTDTISISEDLDNWQ
jgi:hypothetical protein